MDLQIQVAPNQLSPCTSHLFLPCWVDKYTGQGTSSDETGETEVMAINTGLLLAGLDQLGKPQVPSWPQQEMGTKKERHFPQGHVTVLPGYPCVTVETNSTGQV